MDQSLAGPLAHQAEKTPLADRIAAVALFALVGLSPVLRAIEVVLLPGGSATAAERLHFGALEILFAGAVFAGHGLRLPFSRKGGALFLFWLFWSGLAVAFATHPLAGILRQAVWLLHGLAALALWRFAASSREVPRLLRDGLLFGFLLYGAVMAMLLTQIADPRHFPWIGAMLGFRNVRHFSEYAAVATLMALVPFLGATWPKRLAAPVLLLVFAWGFLFWSGGRAAAFMLLLVIAFAMARGYTARPRAFLLLAAGTALLGLLLSIPLTPPDGSFGIFRIAADALPVDGLDDYGSGRADMWRQAVELLMHHPLFGLGPDNYALLLKGVWTPYEHPHDILLQAGLDWGLPGAAAFLGLVLSLLLKAFRHAAGVEKARGLFLVALLLFLVSFLAGPLYYGFSTILFMFSLALALPKESAP
jgi:O-antigen ligase